MQSSSATNTSDPCADTAPTVHTVDILTLTVDHLIARPAGPMLMPFRTWLLVKCVSKRLYSRFTRYVVGPALVYLRGLVNARAGQYIDLTATPLFTSSSCAQCAECAAEARSLNVGRGAHGNESAIHDHVGAAVAGYAICGSYLTAAVHGEPPVDELTIYVGSGAQSLHMGGSYSCPLRCVDTRQGEIIHITSHRSYKSYVHILECDTADVLPLACRGCLWVLTGPRLKMDVPWSRFCLAWPAM